MKEDFMASVVEIKSVDCLQEGDILVLGDDSWSFHSCSPSPEGVRIWFEKDGDSMKFTPAAVEDFIKRAMIFRPILARIKIGNGVLHR